MVILQLELVQRAVSPSVLAPPYMGVTKGFLPLLFEAMEKAPLFNPASAIQAKGDKSFNGALLHRLPFFYNVNNLFFYEKVCCGHVACQSRRRARAYAHWYRR